MHHLKDICFALLGIPSYNSWLSTWALQTISVLCLMPLVIFISFNLWWLALRGIGILLIWNPSSNDLYKDVCVCLPLRWIAITRHLCMCWTHWSNLNTCSILDFLSIGRMATIASGTGLGPFHSSSLFGSIRHPLTAIHAFSILRSKDQIWRLPWIVILYAPFDWYHIHWSWIPYMNILCHPEVEANKAMEKLLPIPIAIYVHESLLFIYNVV